MQVVHDIAAVRRHVARARAAGRTIGLVPTMGALHEGHVSLIRRAVQRCDYVVVTIFVNPTQFGPGEDLDQYPRTLEADKAKAQAAGADLIFAPSAAEMYGPHFDTYVVPETLGSVLCGASRPGHFRGVCTVVAKLFNIIAPDVAVFGQKDAQQAVLIRRMVADLNFPLAVDVTPTVREPDGVAMSSRNAYLSPGERAEAVCLYRALESARQIIDAGERHADAVRRAMADVIAAAKSARIDYIELVDAATLEPLTDLAGRSVLIALAVHVGPARLIDNLVVSVLG